MINHTEVRAATIVSANEFALFLSDESPEVQVRLGIAEMDLPTLATALADAARGQKILAELGYNGAYYVKTYKGTQYVIIKGLAGFRHLLTGTRYLPNNPKVLRVGLGPLATSSSLKANFVLAMTMYTAADIAALVVGDQMTFSKLMGNFVFNGASAYLSGLLSAAAATAISGWFAGLAAPGILGGIVVGIGVSMLMNGLNDGFKISQSLAELMEKIAAAFNNNEIAPDFSFAASCIAPKTAAELVDFEDCIKQQKPRGGPGTGTVKPGASEPPPPVEPAGEIAKPEGNPDEFDKDGNDSYVDDSEPYDSLAQDGYGGRDGEYLEFTVTMRDGATGKVTASEGDNLITVITVVPEKDGSK